MKVLLKIGYQKILLPDDKGLSTILKALSRGILVDDLRYRDEGFVAEEEVNVTVEMIPGKVKVTGKKKPPQEERLALNPPQSILL